MQIIKQFEPITDDDDISIVMSMQFNTKVTKLTVLAELTLLTHWQFWLISSWCLFDKFFIESKNGVLILHLKDGFGSFVLL